MIAVSLLLAAVPSLAAAAPPAVAAAAPAAAEGPRRSWLVRADTVYTAAGDPIESGWIKVQDGKILFVGGVRPEGPFEKLEVAAVTPGLIDLSVRIDIGSDAVEQSSETPAWARVADALDLYSPLWARELGSGVTSVLATPPDRAVIGGLCVALKTGGKPDLASRLLRADAGLRAAIGGEPSIGNRGAFGIPFDFYTRRPTTRMGVEWILRKGFYDMLAAGEHPERATPETAVLQRVSKGEIPLVVQAWTTQDIRTAIFLKGEFSLPHLVIDAAAEAWKDPDMLARSGAQVVLPPLDVSGRIGPEGAFHAWNTAALLQERGVLIALSGHGELDHGKRLMHQPAFAQRAGLTFDQALAAVTINPARMIGVEDRVGSLEHGKDADLVLWSGVPFEPSSRVIGVMLGGELVVDRLGER